MNVEQKRTTLVLMGARFAWIKTDFHTEYVMLINGTRIESGRTDTMSRVPICFKRTTFFPGDNEVPVSEVPAKWLNYLYRHRDAEE